MNICSRRSLSEASKIAGIYSRYCFGNPLLWPASPKSANCCIDTERSGNENVLFDDTLSDFLYFCTGELHRF